MKRILIIIATLSIGGAEKIARDIGLSALVEGDLVHFLVFGDHNGEYEETICSQGGIIIHLPPPSADYFNYYHALKKLMLENRYDVVHAHTMFNIGWAMHAAKCCGVPIRIAHAHSALNDGYRLKKRTYETVMRRLILRDATHLIACGDAAGSRLYGEKAFRERGIRILNGIDTAAFAYREESRVHVRQALGLENAFVIGHVGHLAEVKNQSYLIRLMPKILERKPNAKLLMLGEGEDRIKLEMLMRDCGMQEKIILTGNVRNVSDYLSAMDVFAFPSLYEGTPLSILEVQANGLPCILSTGVPKDVYQTDLIYSLPLDEPQNWIDAICEAKRCEPERYAGELKRKGIDTETVMKQFLEIYKRTERQ